MTPGLKTCLELSFQLVVAGAVGEIRGDEDGRARREAKLGAEAGEHG